MRDCRQWIIGLSAVMFEALPEVSFLPIHQRFLLDGDALEEVDLVLVAFHLKALSSGVDFLEHDSLLLFLLERLNLLLVFLSQVFVHLLRRLR